MRMKERAGYERSTDLEDFIPVDNRVWWTKHLGSSNTSYSEFLFYNSNEDIPTSVFVLNHYRAIVLIGLLFPGRFL